MILTFSKDRFIYSIKAGLKIHTIREDRTNRWREGMSIQFWRGNPRNVHARVRPYQFMTGICTGVQTVVISHHTIGDESGFIGLEIDNIYAAQTIPYLILNDGLQYPSFLKWFVPNPGDVFEGKIIHWTDFRY